MLTLAAYRLVTSSTGHLRVSLIDLLGYSIHRVGVVFYDIDRHLCACSHIHHPIDPCHLGQ